MQFQPILEDINLRIADLPKEGAIATYIPELAKVNPDHFGMSLLCLDNRQYSVADAQIKFSIQSIAKVLSLTMAIKIMGDAVWQRVDVEPSGDPFNSLVQLEYENGIPRNPLINAGAIVISDILVGELNNPKREFLEFVRSISGLPAIDYDQKVAASEKAFGFRNAALANFLKSFGNLNNPVEKVLDFYFHLCSLAMTCEELSRTFLMFANHGCAIHSGESVLSVSQVKRLNALMQTCGFYDEAGEFSFRVGLPGKSGVGGGIVAIHPQKYSVAVWSPRLNPKGNSFLGMKALEMLTDITGQSIF